MNSENENKEELDKVNSEETVDETQQNEEVTTEETVEEQVEEKSELEIAKEAAAIANDKHLRLYSEFDNFRKRSAKERIDLIKSASEDVIKNMLPIVDDFKRAMAHNAEVNDADSIKEGFELIFNKLLSMYSIHYTSFLSLELSKVQLQTKQYLQLLILRISTRFRITKVYGNLK